MSYTFEFINTTEEIISQLSLLQELQPELTLPDLKNNLAIMLPMGYQVILIKENNLVAGLTGIWIGAKLYCGKYIEIDNLVVSSKFRNKGIGKKLCDYVYEYGKNNNCKVVMLDAYRTNTESHRFYERENFEKKGYHFIKPIQ